MSADHRRPGRFAGAVLALLADAAGLIIASVCAMVIVVVVLAGVIR